MYPIYEACREAVSLYEETQHALIGGPHGGLIWFSTTKSHACDFFGAHEKWLYACSERFRDALEDALSQRRAHNPKDTRTWPRTSEHVKRAVLFQAFVDCNAEDLHGSLTFRRGKFRCQLLCHTRRWVRYDHTNDLMSAILGAQKKKEEEEAR